MDGHGQVSKTGYTTIRVRDAIHARLLKLLERISAEGWTSIGVKRSTPPTITDVVEVAIDKLEKMK